MSRALCYLPVGKVDHLTRLDLGSVEGIKSHFCFIGSSGSEGELELVERSCFECEPFFDFVKAKCNHARHTGPLCHVEMMDNTTARPSTRAAQAALLKKVKKHIRPSMNILARLQQQHGSWAAAKACWKVYQRRNTRRKTRRAGTARGGTKVRGWCRLNSMTSLKMVSVRMVSASARMTVKKYDLLSKQRCKSLLYPIQLRGECRSSLPQAAP